MIPLRVTSILHLTPTEILATLLNLNIRRSTPKGEKVEIKNAAKKAKKEREDAHGFLMHNSKKYKEQPTELIKMQKKDKTYMS